MLEDLVMQLPRNHCAIKGRAWIGDTDEERKQHLQDMHAGTLARVAELLPASCSREERFAGAYSEAIAARIRKGTP